MDTEDVPFVDFGNAAVDAKGVRLADVAYDGIKAKNPARRFRHIGDAVEGIIEHGRADQVVQPEVNTGKNGRGRLLDDIDLHQEGTGIADEELPGSNMRQNVASIFFAEPLKRSEIISPSSSIFVSMSPSLYGTLKPLPKSM